MRHLLLIAAFLAPTLACGEVTPPKGNVDPRVRIIDYNPNEVVKISTFYGVSTHVQFAQGETYMDSSLGDSAAWKLARSGNNFFVKPVATNANTNLTVLTNKRTYQFILVVNRRSIKDARAYADPNLIYSLRFRYPEDEANQIAATATRQALGANLAGAKSPENGIQNLNYWVAGSDEISPTAARDDGRFIYLTFSSNRDMPAIYAVDQEGNEALINTNVTDGNTIVIQRMVPHLMLRKGKAVASVINKSFDPNGGRDNTTGTVAPSVERVIKGVK